MCCYLQVLFCSLKFTLALVVDDLQTQLSVHPYSNTSSSQNLHFCNQLLSYDENYKKGQTTEESHTGHLCPCLHAVLQCCQWLSVFSGLACQHLFQLHLHLVQPLTEQPTSTGRGQPWLSDHRVISPTFTLMAYFSFNA